MAIPTQPTETTIIQKAYRLYGLPNPSASAITDALDGIAMVRNDLMDEGREWAFLRKTEYTDTTINQSHVQAPTDYIKLISAAILDGTRRNTAQTGASSSITLAAADNGGEADTEGKQIAITGGTGDGQARQIIDFNTSTKVATIDQAWTTTPDSTSVYLVVDDSRQLNTKQVWNYTEIQQTHLKDEPTRVYHFADNAEGDFYFDYTPDKIYGVRIDYYSDLRKEDTDTSANPRYARILRLLEQLFVQGVFVWLLQNDSRQPLELQKYSSLISRQASQFLYANNAFLSAELAEDVY